MRDFLVRYKWRQSAPYNFYSFPPTGQYIGELITGSANRELFEWTFEQYGVQTPVASFISICCGHGVIERALAHRGVFQQGTGIDLAPAAIAEARRLTEEEGLSDKLTFRVEDLNQFELPEATTDLVIAIGALHHLDNLEHVIRQIHRTLRPGGVLIASEYVGPNYQQLTPRQIELINAVIHLMPHDRRERFEYNFTPYWLWLFRLARVGIRQITGIDLFPTVSSIRRSLSRLNPLQKHRFGKVFDYRPRPYWKLTDPSEGIRAEEIIPQLRCQFQTVDVHPYNGSILLHALDNTFLATHDPNNPLHQEWITLLCDVERRLIALGELQSDNAWIVARK